MACACSTLHNVPGVLQAAVLLRLRLQLPAAAVAAAVTTSVAVVVTAAATAVLPLLPLLQAPQTVRACSDAQISVRACADKRPRRQHQPEASTFHDGRCGMLRNTGGD